MNQIGPLEIVGSLLVIGFIAWQVLFFSVIRPRLMQAIGRSLGVRVAEQHTLADAGSFTAVGKNVPQRKRLLVSMLDLSVILIGTVGICGIAGTLLFLLDDRGVLADWNARLTGRKVVLAVPAQISISRSEPQARVTISIQNTGANPERQCLIGTADYSVRNGYLTGKTEFFDLAPTETRTLELELRARNPPAGTQPVRIKVECSGRVLQIVRSSLQVR